MLWPPMSQICRATCVFPGSSSRLSMKSSPIVCMIARVRSGWLDRAMGMRVSRRPCTLFGFRLLVQSLLRWTVTCLYCWPKESAVNRIAIEVWCGAVGHIAVRARNDASTCGLSSYGRNWQDTNRVRGRVVAYLANRPIPKKNYLVLQKLLILAVAHLVPRRAEASRTSNLPPRSPLSPLPPLLLLSPSLLR